MDDLIQHYVLEALLGFVLVAGIIKRISRKEEEDWSDSEESMNGPPPYEEA